MRAQSDKGRNDKFSKTISVNPHNCATPTEHYAILSNIPAAESWWDKLMAFSLSVSYSVRPSVRPSIRSSARSFLFAPTISDFSHVYSSPSVVLTILNVFQMSPIVSPSFLRYLSHLYNLTVWFFSKSRYIHMFVCVCMCECSARVVACGKSWEIFCEIENKPKWKKTKKWQPHKK